MKFTQGMWRVQEGIQFNWMGHCERLTTSEKEANLLLTQPQRTRGDQLNKGTLSARIRSPIQGVTAVKLTHWDGAEDLGPNFQLNEDENNNDIKIEHSPKSNLNFTSGPLALDINTAPNALTFIYKDTASSRKFTGHSFRSLAFVEDATSSTYRASDQLYAEKDNYIAFALDLSVSEKIYGLGERFGPFVKNGQTVEIWNEDGGTSSELTYKNIPFFLSSRGYGVFINHPGKVMLEIQSERTTRVNIAIQAESVEYMVIAGPTPKDILNRYTRLTGRPALPPAWSYSLWLTTSFTTSYDEQTVTSFLDGFKEREIPLGVFHFDCFWMKGFQWCDFAFDDDKFPDPTAYLGRLRERGIKVCVWINPYIAQASPLFAEGKKEGYFVLRADTSTRTVWQWDNWQAGMAIVDFTNPKARDWYVGKLARLMDLGVDAFKTDFGERIPFDPKKVKYADGSDPVRMHNYYAQMYNQAVFEGMQKHGKDGCLFARSATVGGQMFPVHWGGDCESTFEAMAETLRGGLSLGLSGFGSWAHDIGGFEVRCLFCFDCPLVLFLLPLAENQPQLQDRTH
jgi:alpha-D-xyloside xylohydrolase